MSAGRNPNKLTVHSWNACSVGNKATGVKEYVLAHDVDIFIIVETWLSRHADTNYIDALTPTGYSFINVPRGSRGGGIGIVYKSDLEFQQEQGFHELQSDSCEHAYFMDKTKELCLLVIYKPKSTPTALKDFLPQFEPVLEKLSKMLDCKILIAGDFNIHILKPNKNEVRYVDQFRYIISAAGFIQHITKPTHIKGQALDLLISRKKDNLVTNWQVHKCDKSLKSDHFYVSCQLHCNLHSSRCMRKALQKDLQCTVIRNTDVQQDEHPIRDCSFRNVHTSPGDLQCMHLLPVHKFVRNPPVKELLSKVPKEKVRDLIGNRLGNGTVTNLDGIGDAYGRRLGGAGFPKAKDVFGEYWKRGKDDFIKWLWDTAKVQVHHANACYKQLVGYFDDAFKVIVEERVRELIGNNNVTNLNGIGDAYGRSLGGAGFPKAKDVFDEYWKRGKDDFIKWLWDTAKVRVDYANACYNQLVGYFDAAFKAITDPSRSSHEEEPREEPTPHIIEICEVKDCTSEIFVACPLCNASLCQPHIEAELTCEVHKGGQGITDPNMISHEP
ncbi:uncharacterized protein [Amphiura filiformis]|uniref:uncharacterized protein n=1 Tax=Amphiura filiformis TaxID=82378 RepID=UPI003B21858C